jgi:hypothetical protein
LGSDGTKHLALIVIDGLKVISVVINFCVVTLRKQISNFLQLFILHVQLVFVLLVERLIECCHLF